MADKKISQLPAKQTLTDNDVFPVSDGVTTYKVAYSKMRPDLTNYYNKTQVDSLLGDKADADDVYDKDTMDSLLENKANQSTTYTKTEVDNLIANKQDNLYLSVIDGKINITYEE